MEVIGSAPNDVLALSPDGSWVASVGGLLSLEGKTGFSWSGVHAAAFTANSRFVIPLQSNVPVDFRPVPAPARFAISSVGLVDGIHSSSASTARPAVGTAFRRVTTAAGGRGLETPPLLLRVVRFPD